MITTPEIREGLRYEDFFREYSRPGLTKAVWSAYHKELVARDLLEEGISILSVCKDPLTLDVSLNHILACNEGHRVCIPKGTTIPDESDIEDMVVLDPGKFVDVTESGHGSFPYPRL